jgi:hypothetical protein
MFVMLKTGTIEAIQPVSRSDPDKTFPVLIYNASFSNIITFGFAKSFYTGIICLRKAVYNEENELQAKKQFVYAAGEEAHD